MVDRSRLLQDSPVSWGLQNNIDPMMEVGARDPELAMNEENQFEMDTESQSSGVGRQLGAPFNIFCSTWQFIRGRSGGGPRININNWQPVAYRTIMVLWKAIANFIIGLDKLKLLAQKPSRIKMLEATGELPDYYKQIESSYRARQRLPMLIDITIAASFCVSLLGVETLYPHHCACGECDRCKCKSTRYLPMVQEEEDTTCRVG